LKTEEAFHEMLWQNFKKITKTSSLSEGQQNFHTALSSEIYSIVMEKSFRSITSSVTYKFITTTLKSLGVPHANIPHRCVIKTITPLHLSPDIRIYFQAWLSH